MVDFTRNGICNNLAVSPYFIELENITYYFSSKSYMDKFIKTYKFNREEMEDLIYKRLHFRLKGNQIYDMLLYEKIEKRGYRVEYGGEQMCRNTAEYVGLIKTNKI